MNLRAAADMMIKPHVERIDLRKRRFETTEIVALVQEVIDSDHDDTISFSRFFSPTMSGLKLLFDFVNDNFRYVADPDYNQWVQTPSFLWYTKRGDCKSFTVFISSILRNMGVPHNIRYVAYGGSKYTHVYPVALLNGKEIPIDVVWKKQEGGQFGREKNYTIKKDYYVEGLYKLGTTTSTVNVYDYIGKLETTVEQMKLALADVPESIVSDGPGDITTFTKGELDRWIWQERYNIFADQEKDPTVANQYRLAAKAMEQGNIAGIGNILPEDPFLQQVKFILNEAKQNNQLAFQPFRLEIPNPVPAQMAGFFQDIGKFFKKVGDTFTDLFKQFVNWIFKGVGKSMGPYFIYLFANKNKVKSPEIRRRIDAQQKTFNWIASVGRLNLDQLKGTVLNGIKEQTGMTPGEVFKSGGTPEIGSITAIVGVVIQSIRWVVQAVEKIVGLFKKNKGEAGEIGEKNMSDTGLLEEEARLQKETGGSTGDLNTRGGGFGFAALAALAVPFVIKAL